MQTNGARAVAGLAVLGLVVAGILRVLWGVTRFVLFILMCIFGRFVEPLLRLTSGVGVLVFLFGVLGRTRLDGPMWAGLVMTLGGGALLYGFQAARQALAPRGTVVVSEM